MSNYTCKDCKFDITDYKGPNHWLECDAGGIADEVYEQYGDDELPQHCEELKLKERLKDGNIS